MLWAGRLQTRCKHGFKSVRSWEVGAHLAEGVTFIQVEVTLHEDAGGVLHHPKHQTAFMTLN